MSGCSVIESEADFPIMPFVPSSPGILAATPHWLTKSARILRAVLLVGIVAFCLVLLAVRFVVLPHLESNRGYVAQMLSREIGAPVEIDALATGWDGWNPRIELSGLRILDRSDGSETVALPSARLIVAWTSF